MKKYFALILTLFCVAPVYAISDQEVCVMQKMSKAEEVRFMSDNLLDSLDHLLDRFDHSQQRFFDVSQVGVGLMGLAKKHCTIAEVLCMGQQLLCRVNGALEKIEINSAQYLKLLAVKRVIIQRMQDCFVSKEDEEVKENTE